MGVENWRVVMIVDVVVEFDINWERDVDNWKVFVIVDVTWEMGGES